MHVPFATLILALSGPLCATACVPRQPPARTPGVADPEYAVAIERGRNIVRPLTRRGASVAVAVGVDGKLVWSEGFGREALEGGAPTRPDAPFRVYSLFKQITAAAAIQSAAIGEIDLRASIRRIMPSLPEHLDAVTMQQLLTHTAGIRHYRDSVEAHLTQHCTAAMQALPLFVQDPLVSEPGTRVSYSTWGFALASALLERAAGMRFDSLMSSRIFIPTGMTSAALDDGSGGFNSYDVDGDGRIARMPFIDNSCKMGGGGFVASAEDIVRFHNAVLTGKLVPLEVAKRLLGGRTALLAGGSGPGGESASLVDLERRISVVVVSNTGGLEQRMAVERVRELVAAMF